MPPTPKAPDDPSWPPIPAQDFSNIPKQQRGLHNRGFGDLRLAHKINQRIARWDDRKWDERLEVLKLLSAGQFVEALKTNLTAGWVLRFLATNPRALAEAAGLI